MTTALLLSPDVNETVGPGVSHLCQQQRLMMMMMMMKMCLDNSLTRTATADQHLTQDSSHTHTEADVLSVQAGLLFGGSDDITSCGPR